MFGTYRVLLAVLVAFVHYANFPFIGHYSVFGFFVLSGYMMTYIMHNTYGYAAKGISAFALNRFLRVYPLYWFSCLFAVAVLLVLGPANTSNINPNFTLPENAFGWFRNLALIIGFNAPQTLNAPGWALTVELFFYVAIGLGLSRSMRITQAWFVVSIIYTAYMLFRDTDFVQRYVSVGAVSLPVSLGALIFHYRESLQRKFPLITTGAYTPIFLFGLMLLNWVAMVKLGVADTWGFYLNCMICAMIVVSLMDRRKLPFISRWWDNWFGFLSYPIFCIHFPLGFLLMYLYKKAGFIIYQPNVKVFILFFPILILVSWAMAAGIEQQVEKLRTAVKLKLGA